MPLFFAVSQFIIWIEHRIIQEKEAVNMKRRVLHSICIICMTGAFLLTSCSSEKSEKVEVNDTQLEKTDVTSKGKKTEEFVENETIGNEAQELTEQDVKEEEKWSVVVDTTAPDNSHIEGFINETSGISVGFSGEIHYTEDAGATWPKAENTSWCRFCLDIVNEQLAWCGGNGNHVRVSNDGGKNWTAVTDLDLGAQHNNIDFIDDTTGWVCTPNRCARTIDGGTTWTEIVLPEGMEDIAATALRTEKDGYILTVGGQLYITSDAGTTWSMQDIALDNYKIVNLELEPKLAKKDVAVADMIFTDEMNGMIIFSGMEKGKGTKVYCLRTTDGGVNWTPEQINLVDDFVPTKVFLTSDGSYLTLGSIDKRIVVYKQN